MHGHVRTGEVEVRPRHITERSMVYYPRANLQMEIGFQRLAVLQPVEHLGETAGCENGTRRVGNLTGKGTQAARESQATPEEQKG